MRKTMLATMVAMAMMVGPVHAQVAEAPADTPSTPQQAAGIRIEPPPSLAWAMGTTPAATKAPEPDEEAPAV